MFRRMRYALGAIAVLVTLMAAPASASAGTVRREPGTPGTATLAAGVPIYNYASGKCLDHSNYGTGLYAYVYACNGTGNQSWYWSGSTLRNVTSGKCLDHSNYGTGLYAYVYACNGTDNQQWYTVHDSATGLWEIVNSASGKCLDHSDYGAGLYAYVYSCNGLSNQLWFS